VTRLSRADRQRERERQAACRGLWDAVAMGSWPSAADLHELGFPPATHRGILVLAANVFKTRAGGDHAAARTLAREATQALLDDLGPEWQPPAQPGPDISKMTPDELAEYIVES